MTKKQKKMLIRILSAAVLTVVFSLLPVDGWIRLLLFLVPYGCIGYDILIKAVKGILHGQPFDENFLMAVASVGALALGDYTESCAVMLFYQVGELFQSYAVGKSRRNIGALMDIRPDFANLEGDDGTIAECSPDEIAVGSIIVVRPGEKIPIDGVVVEGTSSLDTVALTGESVPRTVGVGTAVMSGCINLNGLLRVRTTKAFGESTASKILELVENASSRKSRSENFITRFARIYTPVVCIGAVMLALLPPLFRIWVLQSEPMWSDWIYRALTFLVISCPCALVISVPLSFFAGIGGAGRVGVLVKGSVYLERLSQVQTIAFDKTGTMTEGVFEVEEVRPHGTIGAERLLEYAALAEQYSTHPIAESLRKAAGIDSAGMRVSDVTEVGGHGVTACVDGVTVAVGNRKLMDRLGIQTEEHPGIGSVVYVAVDGRFGGSILIADRLKPDAREAVTALRRTGVRRIVMLTGDVRSVGEAVAETLGMDEVRCELLPADKLQFVEEASAGEHSQGRFAFVGDGLNDAPVLTRADVGIAMGALGSDAAIEAADIVLMDDNPLKVAKAMRIARKCMRIVRQNIFFALGVKLLCLIFGAVGIANLWIAVFADVGVMVLAVLNAMRALYSKSIG